MSRYLAFRNVATRLDARYQPVRRKEETGRKDADLDSNECPLSRDDGACSWNMITAKCPSKSPGRSGCTTPVVSEAHDRIYAYNLTLASARQPRSYTSNTRYDRRSFFSDALTWANWFIYTRRNAARLRRVVLVELNFSEVIFR